MDMVAAYQVRMANIKQNRIRHRLVTGQRSTFVQNTAPTRDNAQIWCIIDNFRCWLPTPV
jgi:hypothetical protein